MQFVKTKKLYKILIAVTVIVSITLQYVLGEPIDFNWKVKGRATNRYYTGRDEERQPADDFGASDFAIQFSYAKNNLGGSFKIIRQQIEEEIATGIAVDVGLQRKLTDNLNFGLSLRNLGPKMKFIAEGYNLPLTVSVGAGFTIGGVTLAIDTNYEINERDIKVSFGTEWSPVGFLSLRGGYFLNLLKDTSRNQNKPFSDSDKGLGGGIGIKVLNYNLDYAVVPYSDLGTTQRISFSASF